MKRLISRGTVVSLFLFVLTSVGAQQPDKQPLPAVPARQDSSPKAEERPQIPHGSKVYIAPMDGFETYLKKAFEKKKVPLTVVENKQDAAYEISGVATAEKAMSTKDLILGRSYRREEANIQLTDLRTGAVVFAFSYATLIAQHRGGYFNETIYDGTETHHAKRRWGPDDKNQRPAAEDCAKYLKGVIGSP